MVIEVNIQTPLLALFILALVLWAAWLQHQVHQLKADEKPRWNSKAGSAIVEAYESQRTGLGTIKYHREKIADIDGQILALLNAKHLHEVDIDELIELRLTSAMMDQRRATSGQARTPRGDRSA